MFFYKPWLLVGAVQPVEWESTQRLSAVIHASITTAATFGGVHKHGANQCRPAERRMWCLNGLARGLPSFPRGFIGLMAFGYGPS